MTPQISVAVELSESTSDLAYYLRQQAEQLDGGAAEFAAAYQAGDDDLARSLYAPTRMFYNRMLVVSDSFADLDARLDTRQQDLTAGEAFTGWHAIEQDLYPVAGQAPYSAEQRTALATGLAADTHALVEQINGLRPTVDQQTEGAAKLLQTRGVNAANGAEDAASSSDLYDLQGYVDGAQLVFEGIRVVLVTQDAALATTLDHEFGGIQDSLNAQREGVAFKRYDKVSADDLASLKDKVSALAASLSQVTVTMAPATATPTPAPAG
ncbi:Efem/EfeO family lipoprotein [Subtercola lobariae]|uniref:Efem/EfeO family lipoprotein n=2 Tax=Subtercola lobariae TaxID=1588641 RepID=A0A917EWJ2_9MICO|nr:Efem/EfeO family lipoprotein [Subtercola lobariae]